MQKRGTRYGNTSTIKKQNRFRASCDDTLVLRNTCVIDDGDCATRQRMRSHRVNKVPQGLIAVRAKISCVERANRMTMVAALSPHDPTRGCVGMHAIVPTCGLPNAPWRLDLSGWNHHLATEDDHIIGHAIGLANRGGRDIVLRANARKRVACHDGVDGGCAIRGG